MNICDECHQRQDLSDSYHEVWCSESARRAKHLTPGAHKDVPATKFKLYLSGPITGIEDDNRPAFKRAQAALEAAGYEVVNPHDIGAQSGYQDGLRWSDYLRLDLIHILTQGVEGLATIPGWYKSPGAALETEMCSKLDIPLGPEEFWLRIKKENW